MGRNRSEATIWVSQAQKPTWTGESKGVAPMALEEQISDAAIDEVIHKLHQLDPEREDWTLQVFSAFAVELEQLASRMPEKRKFLFSLMGKRVPQRLAALFGAEAVETLRSPDMKPFDKQLPRPPAPKLPHVPPGMRSYALHRITTTAGAGVASEEKASYSTLAPVNLATLDFKEFLSSCPALSQLSFDRSGDDQGFGGKW